MTDPSSFTHSPTDETNSRSAAQQSAIQLALKKNLQDERIRDAELAMKQMFEREVATVKTVMGYLFDIGSTNLIDKHISIALMKEPLRSIAKLSRPAFRLLAAKWFLANGSKLIADWLLTLVVFDSPQKTKSQPLESQNITNIQTTSDPALQRDQATIYPPTKTPYNTPAQNIANRQNIPQNTLQDTLQITIQQKSAEVITLQKRIRLTASLAIITTTILGSLTLWLGYELKQIQLKSNTTTLTNCQKP